MIDDMEIPELTDEELKQMKRNPYVNKCNDEEKIITTIKAYISYGNIDKQHLKCEINKLLG